MERKQYEVSLFLDSATCFFNKLRTTQFPGWIAKPWPAELDREDINTRDKRYNSLLIDSNANIQGDDKNTGSNVLFLLANIFLSVQHEVKENFIPCLPTLIIDLILGVYTRRTSLDL